MRSKKLFAALVAAGMVLASGSALAGVSWYSPITALQDDDLDYVVDSDNSGTLSVGDRLVSVFEFANSQGVLPGQGPTGFGPHELTGVADVTIAAIDGSGNYIMAASGAAGVLSSFAAGTTIAVFLDATPDLNVINATCGTRATCMSLAGLGLTDGSSLFLTAGYTGDADELWFAAAQAGGGTIATVEGGGSSSVFGTFNLAQGIIVNNTGLTDFGLQSCGAFCNPLGPGRDGLVQVTGNGNILGGQFLNHSEWTARSDTDVQVVPIPEPGSLALIGAALAGLGATRLRRKAQ